VLSGSTFCENFSDPQLTFAFPKLGRKNETLECTRIVEAAADYKLHLQLEQLHGPKINTDPSVDQTWWQLEVRRGLFGFSPLIGKFQLSDLPLHLTSETGEMFLYLTGQFGFEKTVTGRHSVSHSESRIARHFRSQYLVTFQF